VGATQCRQHCARYFTGVRTGLVLRDILGTIGEFKLVAFYKRLGGADIGERHQEGNIYLFVVFLWQSKGELLQLTDSLLVVKIHLPVASNKWGTRHETHILSKSNGKLP